MDLKVKVLMLNKLRNTVFLTPCLINSVVSIINLKCVRDRISCRIAIKANWMWIVICKKCHSSLIEVVVSLDYFLCCKRIIRICFVCLYIYVYCVFLFFNLNGDPPGVGINSRPHQTEKWWKTIGRW